MKCLQMPGICEVNGTRLSREGMTIGRVATAAILNENEGVVVRSEYRRSVGKLVVQVF